ncbi:hypothetical protein BGS_1363 [Beggiatoa sp. SS]|nr:hypothetical protein BGS_1363 [Beggiatoa sp. SS]
MLNQFQYLGSSVLNRFERLGRGHLFFMHVLAGIPGLFFASPLVIAPSVCRRRTLFKASFSSPGFFVRMDVGLQGYNP